MPARTGRMRLRRWRRRLVAALAILVALPLVLPFVYLIPGTRPVSTLMISELVTFNGYDRRWVPIEEMSPNVVNAVMMSEDGQFCSHHGIDWGELRAVLDDFRAGEPTRGASTIPMQTAKNLFLWNGRSYLRKMLELPLAIYIDAVMPKKRLMEIYLNIAEWGPGVYGVEAGAQTHFGKPASQLTPRQGALMAVTLPAPHIRNPAKPGPGLSRIAAIVERRAARSGAYTACLR
ncbi:MAG TPA: monofunctional biosynthetic peptidoglycan transglycosylase [Rhizobiaceae bacterium]|nr:monofunctional biosynthetic peptidoglycan transglycosylase [Rhizobiaceae bacterium]